MGLKFDVGKNKIISMMVETSGIEKPEVLDFTFSISVDGVKYGFPCVLEEGKVNITIPPLNKVIKNLKEGKYQASLDVTDGNSFFIQPYSDEVEIMSKPMIDVIVDDESQTSMVEKVSAVISRIMDDDESETSKDINTSDDDTKSVTDKMFKNKEKE